MKQHHIFLYILMGLSLILCLRYLGEKYLSPTPTSEGFLQKGNFVVKTNNDIYDIFYSNHYDILHKPEIRSNLEVHNIIRMTQPSKEHSCFLDIGSGTGSLLNELTSYGYRAYGIDKSVDMIDYSQKKYPEIQVESGDALETLLFEKGTFTHIICNYFTIYQMKDKIQFFRNCYQWISPGGYLILHLVDPSRFDTIIPAGKPLNIDSPQKYTQHRILETYIEFDDFKYKSKFDPSEFSILETFTENITGQVRQNELQLHMETKEMILGISNIVGFILHGQMNYETISGDPYQYLVILERPM
jgi:SAM-dependent methyltransferase